MSKISIVTASRNQGAFLDEMLESVRSQGHADIEPTLEQIERQRTWCDEEDEDPDRPVIEPVVQLVVFANLAFGRVFDRDSVHGFFVRVLRRFDAGVLDRDVGGRLAFDRPV